MFVRESHMDVEEDVDAGFIQQGARRINVRCTYSTDLLADDILGAFLHALDPADPLSLPVAGRASQSSSSLAAHPDMPKLLQQYTAIFLHAAADVLFNRHGLKCVKLILQPCPMLCMVRNYEMYVPYPWPVQSFCTGARQPIAPATSLMLPPSTTVTTTVASLLPCRQWTGQDMPDAFLMHSILMSGRGAPIALAVLFQAVCNRAGVSLDIAVTDGGSQCVTWPQGETKGKSSISVSGVPLVFDVASHGTISMEEEYKSYLEVNELVPSHARYAPQRRVSFHDGSIARLDCSSACRAAVSETRPARYNSRQAALR